MTAAEQLEHLDRWLETLAAQERMLRALQRNGLLLALGCTVLAIVIIAIAPSPFHFITGAAIAFGWLQELRASRSHRDCMRSLYRTRAEAIKLRAVVSEAARNS